MQEFLLYSQIPVIRHDQVLHILAGVCASQPTQVTEQHLLYQQTRLPEATNAKKGGPPNQQQPGQTQRPGYHKLIREVDLSDGNGEQRGPFRFRAEEIPQAGVSVAISRPVDERILGQQELDRFREGGQWYRYVNQFVAPTQRFVYNNIIIRISRPYSVPEGHGALEPLDAPILPLSDCKPVDPSGSYLFEASIRVEDGKNSKLTEAAMTELLSFKKQVEGAIDLRVPERLSLDPRVKGV